MEAPPINEEQTEQVLQWIDSMTYSRAVKNLARDFSDGVLVAEVVKNNFPSMIQLHNYQPASSSAAKYINWKTLNEKVFKKMGFQIHRADVESVINCEPGSIEKVLYVIYTRTLNYRPAIQSVPNLSLNLNKKSNSFLRNETEQRKQYSKQLSQLAEKEGVIRELRETIEILETKMKKMEQLNKLKDVKIDSLMRKLDESIGL